MKKFILSFWLLTGIVFCAGAVEIPVAIFANDKSAKDSIRVVVNDLAKELQKAGKFDLVVRETTGVGNEPGFSFFTRNSADELGISYPKALKAYNPEGYYIKSNGARALFIGNTALALQHAIFHYLEEIGFRYFMPGETWTVVPSITTPFTSCEKLVQPLFEFRSFANGQGYYRNKKVENDFNAWARANRLGGSFPVRVGHAYQTIVTNNLDEFKRHPEYFANNIDKTSAPATAKFNVANKQLVNLVVKDALDRLAVFKRTGQFMNMISMEPSDGGGFCTDPACLKIGGPSDQAFYLSNAVARAIQRDYPGTWVGTLAYNEHIAPTKYELEPNVFVMVTNGFNRTKLSTNELIRQWKKKAKKVGVYEYLSVYAWDNDLPGRSNATDLAFLKRSIKAYYESGARVYLAETNIGWVSKGPGQYVASKLLWNHRLDVDSIANDFYNKAFGDAAPLIKRLYRAWEKSSNGLISDNSIAEWLALVKEADATVSDSRIRERLDQLKIYLHYLVLYKRLKTNPTVENLNLIMGFAYRTFDASAFATVPVMTSLPFYTGFRGYGIYDKADHPWMKDATQLTRKEINTLFNDDLATVKRIEGLRSFNVGKKFKKQDKSTLSLKSKPDNKAPSFTGETSFLLKLDKRSAGNYIEIKSGYAARPADEKPVTVKIYRYAQYLALKEEADLVFSAEQTSKLVNEKLELSKLDAGDYLVKVDDQAKMFSIQFSPALSYSVIMDAEKSLLTSSVTGLNTFYFSVLPDVKRFIVHKSKVLKLLSPAGRVLEFTDNKQQSIVVEVKDNEKGLWQVFGQAGGLYIEGVPPYLGILPEKMLVPSDMGGE